jgi:hypothetical protein
VAVSPLKINNHLIKNDLFLDKIFSLKKVFELFDTARRPAKASFSVPEITHDKTIFPGASGRTRTS